MKWVLVLVGLLRFVVALIQVALLGLLALLGLMGSALPVSGILVAGLVATSVTPPIMSPTPQASELLEQAVSAVLRLLVLTARPQRC